MCYSALVRAKIAEIEKTGVLSINSEAYEDYFEHSQKKPTPLSERIFPGSFAPVIYEKNGERVAELMRYGVFPPDYLKGQKQYDLVFNARRDNLDSKFWSASYKVHHGFIVLRAFYEWVKVKDLLKAGVVKIDDVRSEFERQALSRKEKIEASGKKYKPTPTELKDPRFRQIIIEFKPEAENDLLVPVIFNEGLIEDKFMAKGFAIVTDDPTSEIRRAGHDRSPIFLEETAIKKWLCPNTMSPSELDQLLIARNDLIFKHKLPKAA